MDDSQVPNLGCQGTWGYSSVQPISLDRKYRNRRMRKARSRPLGNSMWVKEMHKQGMLIRYGNCTHERIHKMLLKLRGSPGWLITEVFWRRHL